MNNLGNFIIVQSSLDRLLMIKIKLIAKIYYEMCLDIICLQCFRSLLRATLSNNNLNLWMIQKTHRSLDEIHAMSIKYSIQCLVSLKANWFSLKFVLDASAPNRIYSIFLLDSFFFTICLFVYFMCERWPMLKFFRFNLLWQIISYAEPSTMLIFLFVLRYLILLIMLI